jgi:antitoxin component YwqK of YwqJK toxin-antitoxin module
MKIFKTAICLFIAFILSVSLFAQEKVMYSPSYDILVEAYEHLKNEEYDKSAEKFEQVYDSDSLFYSLTLPYKMSLYITMEKYEKVKELGDKYWFFRHKLPTEFYLSYGTALDKLEEYDQAQKMYESILEEYPMNYSIWYNYGISLSLAEKHKEAYEVFKTTYSVNPFYDRVHYALALYALREKQTAKAVMALGMYLYLSAERERYNIYELQYADDIAQSKYWTDEDFQESIGFDLEGNSEFASIDQLIHNYVALDKKYKTPSKLTYPFVKQCHLVLSQIESMKLKEDNFWHDTYVSFYQEIMKEDLFPAFTYTISSQIESGKIGSIVGKKQSDIAKFKDWAYKYLDEKYRYMDFPFLNIENKRVMRDGKYHYTSLVGDFDIKDNGNIVTGELVSYNSEGRKTVEGQFNEEGNKDKKWRYYHANGYLKEVAMFKNGELSDSSFTYLENGLLHYVVTYVDNKIEGDAYIYKNGILDRIVPYTKGEVIEGEYRYYHPIGSLSFSYWLKDKMANGEIKAYYDSGELEKTGSYKDDELDGERISYYRNKQIASKENYLEGELDGAYISYYKDGQTESEGSFAEGKKIGEWKSYYSDGKIATISNFDESGKENGLTENFTEEGWKISELTYKKGDIVGYKYFNKEGEVLSEDTRKGGDFYYKSYFFNGNLSMEGTYGKKEKEGVWKTYDVNGNLVIEEEYKNGEAIGEYKEYYPNKEIETKYSFNEEGKASGYYEDYFRNGKLYKQGYLKDGIADGPWITYNRDGSVYSEAFYQSENIEGFFTYYAINGNLRQKSYYEADLLKFIIYYDTAGLAFDTVFETVGERTLELRYCEDCPLFMRVDILNNRYHGNQYFYYPNGKLVSEGSSFNGNRHGKWIGYHYNGKILYEGSYEYGDRTGEWKYYDDKGNLEAVRNYDEGEFHGEYADYDENGKLSYKIHYYQGDRHGEATYYINGKEEHKRQYYYGILLSYSYKKNGKDITVDVENETAEVEIYWNNGKLARKFKMISDWFEGEYLKYYDNGQLAYSCTYANDWIEGIRKEWYPDGKIKYECNYDNGNKNGEEISYYPNGKVKERCEYLNGNMHGNRILYNEKGEQLVKMTYYDDNIIGME